MADATRTIRTRFDGDAKGLVAAAKIGERAVDNFGRNAGKSFTTRFRQWLTGEGRADTMGSNFGKLFGSGVVRGLAVPGFGAQLTAVLVGGVIALAVPAGAAIGAALVSGIGAGLTGLGVFFAAKFQVVKTAWGDVLTHMETTLSQISGIFAPVLVDLATMVSETFDIFAPTLQRVFADLAPALDRFMLNLLVAFQQLEPIIEPVSNAFIAMLDSLGPELPGLFAAIAQNIIEIADVIAANPDAFAAFFVGALGAVQVITGLVSVLAEQWSNFWNDFGVASAGLPGVLAVISGAFISFGANTLSIIGEVSNGISTFFARLLTLAGSAAAALGQNELAEDLLSLAGDLNALNSEVQSFVDSAVGKFGELGAAVANAPKEYKIKGNIADLMSKLRTAQGALAVAPKDKKVAITAEIAGIHRAINLARMQLAGLQGRTVYIDVVTRRSTHINRGLQHGGPVSSGRSYIVGEAGPELLHMNPGGDGFIVPNSDPRVPNGGGDPRVIAKAIRAAIDGATLVVDDRGVGRLVSRQADLYARAG